MIDNIRDLQNLIERDLITAYALSLSRNKKIVTAKSVRSLRSESEASESSVTGRLYGSGGIPYILEGKPANTKLPVDFEGVFNGKKRFSLKPDLKSWKAKKGLNIPDFVLARSIAKKKREPLDLSIIATQYLMETTIPLIVDLAGIGVLTTITNGN